MPLYITIWHPILQPQDPSVDSISSVFNADLGTISEKIDLITAALTATGWSQAITNQFAQNENVGSVKKRDISSPTVHLTMIGMITMSSRMRDILGTESVTQGNEGDNIMVFLSFLPSLYRLIISPSTYGYHVTRLPMWLTLTCPIFDLSYLRCYSTSRQLSLGAVPRVPTYPFMDTLSLVLFA